jgi:hypothetical protein
MTGLSGPGVVEFNNGGWPLSGIGPTKPRNYDGIIEMTNRINILRRTYFKVQNAFSLGIIEG